jgi:putative transposase
MRHRYDQETMERAVRMFWERRKEAPEEPQRASFRRIGELTGIPADTIRGWVNRARVDAGDKPGVTTAERQEIKALRKEVAELKRANEILEDGERVFRGRGARPPTQVIVAYIDAYKCEFGVEPICRVLRDHNLPIAPSTYYACKKRQRSARSLSDERLLPVLKRVHAVNYSVYGVRKMGHALRRQGETIGRDQVARLMRVAGLRGVSRRKRVRILPAVAPEVRPQDLVRRDWFRNAPDLVWVADFTHVRTREGWMYVSFLQDGFSRRILGFAVREQGRGARHQDAAAGRERATAPPRALHRSRRHSA